MRFTFIFIAVVGYLLIGCEPEDAAPSAQKELTTLESEYKPKSLDEIKAILNSQRNMPLCGTPFAQPVDQERINQYRKEQKEYFGVDTEHITSTWVHTVKVELFETLIQELYDSTLYQLRINKLKGMVDTMPLHHVTEVKDHFEINGLTVPYEFSFWLSEVFSGPNFKDYTYPRSINFSIRMDSTYILDLEYEISNRVGRIRHERTNTSS